VPWVLRAQSGAAPADTARKADPPPPPVNHLETALAGFKLTGFAAGSYSYSGHSAGGTAIVGRLYDRLQNRFMLNALAVVLDKPYDPAKFSAGFHTEVLVGQDATVIQSDGGFFNLGPQGDIPHLYVTLNVQRQRKRVAVQGGAHSHPPGSGGHRDLREPQLVGGEPVHLRRNFTATGLSVETKFNNYVDLQLRVINGWDQVSDNNSHKSFMGRVGLYPDALTSLGSWVLGRGGTGEQQRQPVRLRGLLWRKLGKAAVWVQGDYGHRAGERGAARSHQDAKWWALGGWVTYDLSARSVWPCAVIT